jgi:hypothetical protein
MTSETSNPAKGLRSALASLLPTKKWGIMSQDAAAGLQTNLPSNTDVTTRLGLACHRNVTGL